MSLANSYAALSAYTASNSMSKTSECPEVLPTRNSGAKPKAAFLTVVCVPLPSGPGSGSNVQLLPPIEAEGRSPSENVTEARSMPSHSSVSAAKSPNAPPSLPPTIRSKAAACPSDADSSTTTPSFQLPAVRFDGNRLTRPRLTPDRSVPSSSPSAMWNTATPRHCPSGLVGGPSVGHGQIRLHEQLAT